MLAWMKVRALGFGAFPIRILNEQLAFHISKRSIVSCKFLVPWKTVCATMKIMAPTAVRADTFTTIVGTLIFPVRALLDDTI